MEDEGRDLERARSSRNREHPLGREVLNVAGVDLIERAETIPARVSVVGRPRARFRPRDIFEGNARGLRVQSCSEQTDAEDRTDGQRTDPYHRCPRGPIGPRSVSDKCEQAPSRPAPPAKKRPEFVWSSCAKRLLGAR